jgi:hypothetical protein
LTTAEVTPTEAMPRTAARVLFRPPAIASARASPIEIFEWFAAWESRASATSSAGVRVSATAR